MTVMLAAAAAAAAVAAQDVASSSEEDGTSGEVTASFANATGNTENLTLILTGKLRRAEGPVAHQLTGGARYAESAVGAEAEREQTQEAVFAAYQFDADLEGEATFAYARARYDFDAFSGFEHRVFVGGGLGRRVYDGDRLNWTVRGGPGLRWTQLATPTPAGGFDAEETELSVFLGSAFAWDVNDEVGVQHDAEMTYTEASTTLESVASLKSSLTERMTATMAYTVRHETSPPEGREATDTLLSAGLTYGF